MIVAEQVTQYRTQDGLVFATQALAEQHEDAERLYALLDERAAYREIDVGVAVEVLTENAAEIIRLLGRWV